MDAIQAILTRRSIRKYTSQSINDWIIQDLLKAAMSAPSAGNQQPWHFLVIKERRILDEIPKFHPYSNMLRSAPAAILICGDERLEVHRGYWIQDCAAATQNMLLAAHALGLGAVWLGVFPNPDRVAGVRKVVDLPHDIIPFALISMGYPAEQKPPAQRFDLNRIHYEQW